MECQRSLAVGLSGKEALLVTVVHGLPKQIGAVLVRLVVSAAPVAIVRGRVEVGIVVVIVAVVAEVLLLLSQVPYIRLVITVLRVVSLPLKLCLMLTPGTLPLNQVLAVLPHTPLMLPDQLLLALLREARLLPISVLPLLLDLLLPVLVSLPSALLVLVALVLVARLLGVLLLQSASHQILSGHYGHLAYTPGPSAHLSRRAHACGHNCSLKFIRGK